MAILLILFALVGFVFAGIGSSSSSQSGSGSAPVVPYVQTTSSPRAKAMVGAKCVMYSRIQGAAPKPRRCKPPAKP